MKFAVQINSGPYQNQGSDTAYQFIRAALSGGHEVIRVFFYHDGVYNALNTTRSPQDERQVVKRWSDLASEYPIDLVLCISASERRGIIAQTDQPMLAKGFRIAGLGLWLEACLQADRFLVFG